MEQTKPSMLSCPVARSRWLFGQFGHLWTSRRPRQHREGLWCSHQYCLWGLGRPRRRDDRRRSACHRVVEAWKSGQNSLYYSRKTSVYFQSRILRTLAISIQIWTNPSIRLLMLSDCLICCILTKKCIVLPFIMLWETPWWPPIWMLYISCLNVVTVGCSTLL